MTKEEAVKALNELQGPYYEDDHEAADKILLKVLSDNGFEEVASAFINARERVGFLYA